MSSKFSLSLVIMLFVVVFVMASPAYALGIDIPIPKPKKEKKKEDKGGDEKNADTSATKKDVPDAANAYDADAIKCVEPLIAKALEAYNNKDFKAFFADFTNDMKTSMAHEATYNALYGPFASALGKFVSKSLLTSGPQRSSITKDGPGLFNYAAEFEKKKDMLVQVNYIKEDGAYKIMQIQFNGADGNPLDRAVLMKDFISEVKLPKSDWDKMKDHYHKGEWVEYEYPGQPGSISRTDVIDVGTDFVTLKSTTTAHGVAHATTYKMIYSEPDPKVEEVKEGQHPKLETKEFADKVDVKDKGSVAATRFETYVDGKLTGKMWSSKEVPCGGVVKGETPDGKVTIVLTAYGK